MHRPLSSQARLSRRDNEDLLRRTLVEIPDRSFWEKVKKQYRAQTTGRNLIDDMRLIAKAMTHNPDYADEVAEVGSLTNKLNKTENQYDTLVRDQQHLAIKL